MKNRCILHGHIFIKSSPIMIHTPEKILERPLKTAITLTKPTVGRQSADLSADDRSIKCQILALFSSADKNKL